MRLEITLDKKIIRSKFDLDTKYDELRNRINRHVLVISDELKAIWDKDAEENGYKKDYDEWLSSILRENYKIKKVSIEKSEEGSQKPTSEETIIINSALESKDKIVIGDYDKSLGNRFNKIRFVSYESFLRENKQTVKLSDIEEVLVKNKCEELFDIYETPIRVEVTYGNADILARYLSKFYKESTNITIKDKFLGNPENERNLKQYILKYINRDKCRIKFILYWDKKDKEHLEQRFKDYDGFKSDVILAKKDMAHSSYIETDKYMIDLGYRLKVFGGLENDGETEYEIVNITKK